MKKSNRIILIPKDLIVRRIGNTQYYKKSEMGLVMNLKLMGRKIKEAREKKGYTQEQLAERLNLSVQHVSVIERGVKAPRLETFVHIANELDVNADYLLEDLLSVSVQLFSNELYCMMEGISEKEKKRILEVVNVLVKTADKA